jgi:hypothetical protein
MARPISDAWFHRIKAATRDLVKACGGVERTAELAHVSKSEVSRWQVATDESVLPIAAALVLEAECGLPLVTTVMAELNGRRLTDGSSEGGSAAAVASRQAEVFRAAAELMARGAQALADGELTAAEAEIVDRAAAEVQRAIAPLRLDLAAAKAGEGAGLKVVR